MRLSTLLPAQSASIRLQMLVAGESPPPPDENQHQTGHHPVIITPMPRIGKKRVEPNPLRPPSSRKKKRAKRGSDDDSDNESEEEDNGDDEDWRPR